ncbi:MAG: ABC transporter permease [Phycisphaerae bacterium]|nr:ABC transporter permease [Phycisphaerae bacterium]
MRAPLTLWAVARQTFSQTLRMKLAAAFIVLLGVWLAVLPFVMKGDGTLAGSIRTFLSYSVSATGVLLSLVTVLAVARVISSDVEDKQIYLLAVKPIARWQYLLGRWFGVLLLDALLLAIAAGVIYGVAQNLRARPTNSPLDRRTIETEIFAARREVKPLPPDIDAAVSARLAKLRESGQLRTTVEEYQLQGNLTRKQAEQRVLAEIEKNEFARRETAGPGKRITWKFKGLTLDEAVAAARGTVTLDARKQRAFRVAAPREFLGRLMYGRPVNVDGVRGWVQFVGETDFDVQFAPDDMGRAEIERLQKDATVSLEAEPTFQFRYKVIPQGEENFSSLYRRIEFYSPAGVLEGYDDRDLSVKSVTTLSVPAGGSLRSGEFRVDYVNPYYQPAEGPERKLVISPEVRVSTRDVSILYTVGGFDVNFLQAMTLIFIQLVFLAALAVFLASFLSFPVAAMTVLVLLGAGMLLGWLTDAVKWSGDFTNTLGAVMLLVVKFLMPSLADTSPSEKLVDGIYISWTTVGETAGLAIGVRTILYLALGCLIFQKRELAKVQV